MAGESVFNQNLLVKRKMSKMFRRNMYTAHSPRNALLVSIIDSGRYVPNPIPSMAALGYTSPLNSGK
jgi:hypothetical protein